MTDFLDGKKKEIDERLRELRPLVDEFHRLEAAAAALSGVGRETGTRQRSTRGTRRRSGSGTGRRGRPRGSGTRALQALEIVKAKPGVTIPELAQDMGIKQNYLYRVMPTLQSEGKVSKRGRGWHATAAAA